MKKIEFVNGTTIDAAETFNNMQSNIEEVFDGEEAMGSIVVDDIECTNKLNVPNPYVLTGNQVIYFNKPLKAGTYTIGFASKTTDGANNCRFIISKTSGGTAQDITLYGENKKTFTITEECNKIEIYSQDTWANSQGKTTTFNELVLVKGTELLPYSPYKKIGYNSQESMGKIVVDDISCKQLFDKNNITSGASFSNTGEIESNSYTTNFFIQEKYLAVESSKNYIFSSETSTDRLVVCEYDASKTFIKRNLVTSVNQLALTTSSTTKYVRLCGSMAVLDALMFEKGGTRTPYTPYKNFEGRTDIITGYESATNEYVDNKRVYVKRINFGTMAGNATNIYNTNIPFEYSLVRTHFIGNNTVSGQQYTLPYFVDAGTYIAINTINDGSNHKVSYTSVGTVWANTELIVEIYYTKSNTSSVSTTSLEEEVI